ncbi:MAG: AMP-binding protein [Bacteroidales bacterium]|nr:AMP-binding protein [Bacteroidales bacterium]
MSNNLNLNPEIERKSPLEIKLFQEQLLRKQIAFIAKKSPFYKKLFQKEKIDPNSIRTIEDLSKIPLTAKDDLNKFNDQFICVDRSQIIDYITTSGTLGDPVTFILTEKDLERLAYNEAISFVCSGCSPEDIFQLTTTIDKRFMAGLAYFLGARKLGAGIVRVGAGIPELQWDTISRVNPTTIIAVPSFIIKLIEYAEKNNIDYRNTSVNKAICIGEPLRKQDLSLSTLAERIKEKWDIKLYSTYASTEMSTAFAECKEGAGGHHHPELIIVEFIDENGNPVKPGEPGEVIITTLGIEGMPLLRFNTGDICHHYTDPCACGRTTMRLGPVLGRRKQMIKFKGTTVYPPALYDILDDISEIDNYIVETYTNDIGTDEILIKASCKDQSEAMIKRIKDHFRAKLRVSPAIEFLNSKEIDKIKHPENSRKPVIFHDKRIQ